MTMQRGKPKGTVHLISQNETLEPLYAPPDGFIANIPEKIAKKVDKLSGAIKRSGYAKETYKWSDSLLALRNAIILDLIAVGVNKRDTTEYLSDKTGFMRSTVRKWYEDALRSLVAEADKDLPQIREVLNGRLEFLYNKCIEKRDYATALKCLSEIGRVRGITEDPHMVMNNITFKFGDEPITVEPENEIVIKSESGEWIEQ